MILRNIATRFGLHFNVFKYSPPRDVLAKSMYNYVKRGGKHIDRAEEYLRRYEYKVAAENDKHAALMLADAVKSFSNKKTAAAFLKAHLEHVDGNYYGKMGSIE